MATRDSHPPTTNEEDQLEAARIQERLKANVGSGASSSHKQRLTSVSIADGAHKYVQIRASLDGEEQDFVVSRRGASYHRNAAAPFIAKLEQAGYEDIEVRGGGRLLLDEDSKVISIFGFSYGFGQANHAISQRVCQADPRYKDFEIKISNDGY